METVFASEGYKVELNNSFYVTKAIEYIEKNTFTNLSVNDIARYLNISRSHLYALFKQELNTSPQQFLTNAKIANARELLSKTKILKRRRIGVFRNVPDN